MRSHDRGVGSNGGPPRSRSRSLPGTPAAAEALGVGAEVFLQPSDCVALDHFAVHAAQTGWNASDGSTVLSETRLFKTDEPFTTFVDAEGIPLA